MKRTETRYPIEQGRVCIDLNLHHINQIFDSLDPSPFLERDLDRNAAEYIVSATMEHSMHTPIKIRVHIADVETFSLKDETIVDAIHNHFAYSAELMRKKNMRILRQGRLSFLIAIVLLIFCLTVAQRIDATTGATFLEKSAREGLIILGWVAMWRPIDVFLYSWWPQVEMRRVFEKLSKVPIDVHQSAAKNA